MPKQKIAIISVLKPVDDIRSFEKLARTLAENPALEIHLYGYPGEQDNHTIENIHFHPHRKFKPFSVSRIKVRFKLLIQMFKLKPELIIANTHELLNVILINKILFGTKICYDIQENYYRNLRYQPAYPGLFGWMTASLIRIKEIIISPFINHFLLAEKCYKDEISFVQKRYTILENKAIAYEGVSNISHPRETIQLLFSGTITESNGIINALEIFEAIKKQHSQVELLIIGHCPSNKIFQKLHQINDPQVKLKISPTPIPHAALMNAMATADIGIISYAINPSNENCMPTKVFEYCAYQLPMIYQKDAHWANYISQHGRGRAIDFNDMESTIWNLDQLKEAPESSQAFWTTEKHKLINAIDGLLK